MSLSFLFSFTFRHLFCRARKLWNRNAERIRFHSHWRRLIEKDHVPRAIETFEISKYTRQSTIRIAATEIPDSALFRFLRCSSSRNHENLDLPPLILFSILLTTTKKSLNGAFDHFSRISMQNGFHGGSIYQLRIKKHAPTDYCYR